MKTSKIIFITLLSTIALIILFVVVDFRLTGRKGAYSQTDFKAIKKKVPAFKVLSLKNKTSIELVQSDSSYIEVQFMKDSIAPDIKYTTSGDTLLLQDEMMSGRKNRWITIHSTDVLKQIVSKNSSVRMTNFRTADMAFGLDQSTVDIYQANEKKSTFQFLNVSAKDNSKINVYNTVVDSLKVDFHNSKATFMISLNKICGSLACRSSIILKQVDEISLKKDATSKINIYN